MGGLPGGGLILKPTAGFSPEAQAVINRMTGLTNDEKNAIATFVDAEVLNGNYALYDEFWCYGLTTAANALTGWLTKTATNNGATKTVNGFSFDGITDYVDTNFTPSIDAVKFTSSDCLAGAYQYQKIGDGCVFGSFQSAPNRVTQLFNFSINAAAINAPIGIDSGILADNTLAVLSRPDNKLYKNGVSANMLSATEAALTSIPFYVGCRNSNGSPANFSGGVISTFIIGAGNGFNHLGHNTNINTLLTSLGAI